MSSKKKRLFKRVFSMFSMMVLLVGISGSTKMQTYAAEKNIAKECSVDILQMKLTENANIETNNNSNNVRTMLYDCSILYGCSEAGLHIEISTGAVGVASVLGVKDVVIKQKVWYGWKTIATGNGAEDTDCTHMTIMIDYPNVEVGETYRITCVHYGTVDTYIEGENDTGAFVFTY